MANFCKKCGSKLDVNSGKCPNCDRVTQVHNPPGEKTRARPAGQPPRLSDEELKAEMKRLKKEKKKQKRAQLSTKQKVKRFLVKLFLIIIFLSLLAGSGTVVLVHFNILDIPFISDMIDTASVMISQEKDVRAIEKAFKDDDVEKINSIIFADNVIKVNDDIDLSLDFNNSFNGNGFIGHILKKTTLDFTEKDDNSITYKIKTPNMQGVFDDALSIQTQDDLLKHIISYSDSSELVEKTVSVNYIVVDNKLVIDYQTTEFIDAILGGIITEYQELYQKALDEISQ